MNYTTATEGKKMTKYEARMMLMIAGAITVVWCLTWVLAALFHVAGVDGG